MRELVFPRDPLRPHDVPAAVVGPAEEPAADPAGARGRNRAADPAGARGLAPIEGLEPRVTFVPSRPVAPVPDLVPHAGAWQDAAGSERGPARADDARIDAARAAGYPARTSSALVVAREAYLEPPPEPAARPSAIRWRVTWRAAIAALVALALVAGAVALWAASRPTGPVVDLPEPLGTSSVVRGAVPDASEPAAAEATGPATAQVVVHVVGRVRHEGVVRLPAGARVADAVDAAGGATGKADLDAINLARVLVDGEQLVVPAHGDPAPAPADGPSGPGTGAGAGGALVDLNSADASALDGLPGIGPVLAERIVTWRGDHRFTSVDDLQDVPGIGPALMSRLRDLVRV